MQKLYIECFHKDGSQILGNLDGQAVITARCYKRTSAYKRLAKIVAFARVVTQQGMILEQVIAGQSKVDGRQSK